MVIDVHLHCTGQQGTAGVLRALDEAEIDVGMLLAPFLSPGCSLDEADFEALHAHRGARVTLDHLDWPWTDEAIAVGLIDRIDGVPDDAAAFRFDLSFGSPPAYRREVRQRDRRRHGVVGRAPGSARPVAGCAGRFRGPRGARRFAAGR